jgi:hypothetical protein
MRRPVPDLETWLEAGSLTEANRDLLKLLRSLSAGAGQPDSGKAAALAYYKVHREIQELISRKLRAERRRAHGKKTKAILRRQHGTKGWQVLLLRIKAYEFGIGRPRQSRDQAQQLALQDFKIDEEERRVIWKERDLSPVERRALAILNRAQRAAKKSILEQRAIKLADAVTEEWFRPQARPGRPAGAKIRLARRTVADKPKLPSVAEVIKTILPTIEQLAGPKASSSPKSTMIKAIASAVRSSTDLECPPDFAASVVRRVRRTSGPLTTWLHFVFGGSD